VCLGADPAFVVLFLVQLGQPLPIERGHIVAHASGVLHGGHPITSGIRYILVAFVIVEGYQNWAMRFMKDVWEL